MSHNSGFGHQEFEVLTLLLWNFSDVLVEAASLRTVEHEDDWLHACACDHCFGPGAQKPSIEARSREKIVELAFGEVEDVPAILVDLCLRSPGKVRPLRIPQFDGST